MKNVRSLLAVAVTLSACSGPAAPSGGPGVYTGESNEASQVIAVPAAASDKTMAAVLAYAKKTGYTEPLAFVTVELKNNGADKVTNCPIRIVTESGETVEFSAAMHAISDMQDLMPTSDVSTYNDGIDLYNSMLNADRALPGATTTALYAAAHGEIASVKSVFAGTHTEASFMQGCDQELSKQG